MCELLVLDIEFTFGNVTDCIHPVILRDSNETVLVDCAYPGFLPKIKEALSEKGILPESITKIIITHHDYDHMGALAEFIKAYPEVSVLAPKEEVPYIEGKKKSLRLFQAEKLHDTLPEEAKEGSFYLQKLFASVTPAKVDVILSGNEILPWCGGCEIVPTPGHMPGHISLYLTKHKTLILGDALAVSNGKLGIANPEYTLNMSAAKQSVKRLLDYDIERMICYHGGIYEGNIKLALTEIL